MNNYNQTTVTNAIRSAFDFAVKGEWNKAHQIVQRINTPEAAWLHAIIHREEGDDGNASYWYYRAGRAFPNVSIDKELELYSEKVIENGG